VRHDLLDPPPYSGSHVTRARRLTVAGVTTGAVVASAVLAFVGVLAYANVDQHGNTYARWQLAIGACAVAVGGYVTRRRRDHPLGPVLVVAGAGSLLTFAGSSMIDWILVHEPDQELLVRVILHSSIWGWIVTRYALTILAPLVYPGGWPRSWPKRALWWTGVATIVVTTTAHSRLNTPEFFAGQPPVGTARLAEDLLPWGHRIASIAAVIALATMCATVARLRSQDRNRHAPFACALLVLTVPMVDSLYGEAFGEGFLHHSDTIELWGMVLLPLVLAGGIFFGHALDIDVVLRRTTTYAALTTIAAGVYVAVVWLVSSVVQQGSHIGPVAATGVIAAGVVPAHAVVERLVARRVFGNRINPYAVVAAVGDRLEHAPPGDQALQSVVRTLGEQLRLPFVAVELITGDAPVEAARWGYRGPPEERFALTFQGEQLGHLIAAQRTDREPFRPAERELLATFAGQCGVVAHNASLTEALRRSRKVLLEAREAERRRIRRDLHDGLGPTLATVSLSLGAAAERLQGDADLAALLRDLEAEIHEAITDIRRLVNDLRPPALDDLGLVEALRGEAARLGSTTDGLTIDVADTTLTLLPAPVELAAYRIAVEAMTNAARHAEAHWCRVNLEQNHRLIVRVDDDGTGIGANTPRGIGLRSMQERVAELGGSLQVLQRMPCGTSVVAAFPLEDLG
jgi:two-component system NarL family sensor kinase